MNKSRYKSAKISNQVGSIQLNMLVSKFLDISDNMELRFQIYWSKIHKIILL